MSRHHLHFTDPFSDNETSESVESDFLPRPEEIIELTYKRETKRYGPVEERFVRLEVINVVYECGPGIGYTGMMPPRVVCRVLDHG